MAQKPLTEGVTKGGMKPNAGLAKPQAPTLSRPPAPPAPKPKD